MLDLEMPSIGGTLTRDGEFNLPENLDMATLTTGDSHVQCKYEHLRYLSDFRVEQCPLFANHKCPNHKPFTCFYWHFPNQRRRRPQRKSNGTFSYSPDVYCDKYNDITGECENGDSCPYLHRNAGDTERRYHLRYYKTGTCIYETDVNGECLRNGAHCAFAHGSSDLRVPVYDAREAQQLEMAESAPAVNLPASLEKERVLAEDPKWNDMAYVLANYKTELCRKPLKMCRQGYACPYYHNGRDRRRSPIQWQFKSTPCPSVKVGDDWQDSNLCNNGDACTLCHTRTEQQFHSDVFKSTRCNDMMQNHYCPRGAFCAFAHNDEEMQFGRTFMQRYEAAAASMALSGIPIFNQQTSNGTASMAETWKAKSEFMNLLPQFSDLQLQKSEAQKQHISWGEPLKVQTAIGSERSSIRGRNSNSNSSSYSNNSSSRCTTNTEGSSACSPIIAAESSAFANPHADLQLLQLQQETQAAQLKAAAMQEARDLATQQRNAALHQLRKLQQVTQLRLGTIMQTINDNKHYSTADQIMFIRNELLALRQLTVNTQLDAAAVPTVQKGSSISSSSSSSSGNSEIISDCETEKDDDCHNFAEQVKHSSTSSSTANWEQLSPKSRFAADVTSLAEAASEAGKR